MDDELRDALLSKPADPKVRETVIQKSDPVFADAIHYARFCPDCPHEKVDHPKKNRFRCKFCQCEGTSIKRAIFRRQRGKRMPS